MSEKVFRFSKHLAKAMAACLAGALFFLFNFLFTQRYIDWDQVFYLHNIEHLMNPRAMVVYLPNHLHFQAGARVFNNLVVEHFGEYGFTDMVWNMRLRSCIAASIGLVFSVLFLSSVTGRLAFGVLGALLIGACHGYLLYATKVDTPIFPALGMILMLWAFSRLAAAKSFPIPLAVICGIACFLAVMFHQYMAFACIALVACIILPSALFRESPGPGAFLIRNESFKPLIELSKGKRYACAITAAFAGLALVSAGYFYAGKTVLNLPFDKPNPRQARFPFKEYTFSKWLFLYSSYNKWGFGLNRFTLKAPLRGFTNSIISPAQYAWRRISSLYFPYNFKKPLDRESLPYNLVAVLTIITVCCVLLLIVPLWKRYGRNLAFILFSFASLAVFFSYWEPRHVEFWVVPAVLFCSLFVLILNFLAEKLSRLIGRLASLPFYILLSCVIALLFIHNLKNYVVPFTKENRIEEMDSSWEPDYYMDFLIDSVYKDPGNPFASIYKAEIISGQGKK